MEVNLLFFTIFVSIGMILLILSLILKNKDNKTIKQCNETIKGKVIKYTIWNNNGVRFPIVEYVVNNVKYNQRLKYGWIITKSSSFNKIKSKVESDIKSSNLTIRKNEHISTNALEEHFPIGTEMDVYYNPQDPNKSYVMRFVKNPVIRVFFLIGILFVALSIIGLVFLPNNINKDNIDERLFTFVIPEAYFEYSGGSATETVHTLTELGGEFCTNAETKENNLIIEVTDIQRENLIKRNNEYADEIIEEFKNSNVNYDVDKSKDYKNLTIYADENFNTTKFVKVTFGVASGYMLNNILEGNNEDWSVYLKIVNCNTGKTVAEGNVPQDTFSLGPEEWKSSY